MRREWLALALLVGATVATGDCVRARHRPPPAIAHAWQYGHGEIVMTAWRDGTSLFVQRDGEQPRRVYTHASLQGQPELEPRAGGFFVATTRATTRSTQADGWRDEVLVPIDHHGATAGLPRSYRSDTNAEHHCASRGGIGQPVTAFWGADIERNIEGPYVVDLSTFDARGERLFESGHVMTSEPSSCMLARRNNELVLAVNEGIAITLSFHHGVDLTYLGEHRIYTLDYAAPMSVTAVGRLGQRYAVLHGTPRGALVVTPVDRNNVGEDIELPPDVDAGTVDLGETERGLFVAWVRGRTLTVRALSGGKTFKRSVPAGSTIRIGDDPRECIIAVTSPGTNAVTVVRFPECT